MIVSEELNQNIRLTKYISQLERKISFYQVIMLNGIVSTLVFLRTQKSVATWPMIESIPSLQKLNNIGTSYTTSDYLINSNLVRSGRTPFLYVSHFLSMILNLSPEQYLAIGTAFLIPFGPIIVLLTLIQTRRNRKFGKKTFTILDCLALCILQYFLAHYGPRLALAGYSSYRFPLGLNGETLSIFLISLSIFGITNVSRRYSKVIFKLILFFGIVIHPAVGVTFLALWVLLKIVNNNYAQIMTPTLPLVMAAAMEIFLSRSGNNLLTSVEFTQIWSRLRVPHHMIPTYFFSKIFLIYFLIALAIVIICRLTLKLGKPFRHALSLLLYVSGILLLQYWFVERESVLIFSQLSLTRGFVFIGFGFCVFFYWIYEDIYAKLKETKFIHNRNFEPSGNIFIIPLNIFMALVLFLTASNIKLDIESSFSALQQKVRTQFTALSIAKGDVILLDPVSVDSRGWREYGFVNIWMDSYVPYDIESVSKYRDRWLQLCGDRPMESCQYLTNQYKDKDFEAFMKKNGIDVLVRGTNNSKLFPHGWVRSGVSEPYEAFRKTPGK
jgi:hypothetical protein